MSHEREILDAIAAAIADATGMVPDADAAVPVAGGDINRVYRLGDWFVKLNKPAGEAIFAAEAEGLEELARVPDGPRVPRPVCRALLG